MASRIGIVDRIKARQITRSAWIKSNQRGDDAKLIAHEELKAQGFEQFMIALIMLLVEKWLEHWFNKGIDEPSVVIQPDEPGFDEVNDAD